jgi:hypothetical protein
MDFKNVIPTQEMLQKEIQSLCNFSFLTPKGPGVFFIKIASKQPLFQAR